MSAPPAVGAAGFGQRALAWSLDFLLLSPVIAWRAWPPLARALASTADWFSQVQGWMLERMLAADGLPPLTSLASQLLEDPVQGAAARAQVAQLAGAVLQGSLWAGAVMALYFVACESSAWQATLGKRVLGLRVETLAGQRLSIAQALLRHLAGIASWLTLNLGHLLVAWRPDRRALHDLIAGTRVRANGPLPAWGRVALALLAALAVLAPLAFAMQAMEGLAGA